MSSRIKVRDGVEVVNSMNGFWVVFDGQEYPVPFGSFDGALAMINGPHLAWYREKAMETAA